MPSSLAPGRGSLRRHQTACSVALARRTADLTHHTNAFTDLDRDPRFIPLRVEAPRVLTPTQIRRYNEAGHLWRARADWSAQARPGSAKRRQFGDHEIGADPVGVVAAAALRTPWALRG